MVGLGCHVLRRTARVCNRHRSMPRIRCGAGPPARGPRSRARHTNYSGRMDRLPSGRSCTHRWGGRRLPLARSSDDRQRPVREGREGRSPLRRQTVRRSRDLLAQYVRKKITRSTEASNARYVDRAISPSDANPHHRRDHPTSAKVAVRYHRRWVGLAPVLDPARCSAWGPGRSTSRSAIMLNADSPSRAVHERVVGTTA